MKFCWWSRFYWYYNAYVQLIEYSDNYSDASWSLWCFKRDEVANHADVANNDNVPSFKYKANLIGNTKANVTTKKRNTNSCITKIFA